MAGACLALSMPAQASPTAAAIATTITAAQAAPAKKADAVIVAQVTEAKASPYALPAGDLNPIVLRSPRDVRPMSGSGYAKSTQPSDLGVKPAERSRL